MRLNTSHRTRLLRFRLNHAGVQRAFTVRFAAVTVPRDAVAELVFRRAGGSTIRNHPPDQPMRTEMTSRTNHPIEDARPTTSSCVAMLNTRSVKITVRVAGWKNTISFRNG